MEEEGNEDRCPPSVARGGLLLGDHVRDGDIYPRPLYHPSLALTMLSIDNYQLISAHPGCISRRIANRCYQEDKALEDARLPGRRCGADVTIRGSNVQFW